LPRPDALPRGDYSYEVKEDGFVVAIEDGVKCRAASCARPRSLFAFVVVGQLSGRHPLDEACVRRMDVEYSYPAGAGIAEAMLDATWPREERARAATTPLAVNEKLDLTLDDVKRVGVIRVGVGINALPAVLERGFYNLQIRQEDEQPKASVSPVQPLALTFGYKAGVHSGRIITYWRKRSPWCGSSSSEARGWRAEAGSGHGRSAARRRATAAAPCQSRAAGEGEAPALQAVRAGARARAAAPALACYA
jgi:hypothetical protein